MARKKEDSEVQVVLDGAEVVKDIKQQLDKTSEELFTEISKSLPITVVPNKLEVIWNDPRNTDDWTEQVIGALRDGEVVDGKPTTKGLRRYIRTVFRVISSTTQLGACVGQPGRTIDDSMRGASAVHIIKLITPDGITEEWGGAADAFYDNLDGKFRKYPTAMADTRAEGRALVRALNLKCVTYDEIQGGDDSDKEPANDAQWGRFDTDFKKFDINAGAFFNAHKDKLRYPRAAALTHSQVVELFGVLNSFKQGAQVPQEWRGYDARWMKVVKGV